LAGDRTAVMLSREASTFGERRRYQQSKAIAKIGLRCASTQALLSSLEYERAVAGHGHVLVMQMRCVHSSGSGLNWRRGATVRRKGRAASRPGRRQRMSSGRWLLKLGEQAVA